VANERKVQCDASHAGQMLGICDGFGACQCAAPFLGDDCSVRDCPNNCSTNGYCDVQFPVSRCICEFPFVGDDCSKKACLNNCSYPNGICDQSSGLCTCSTIMSPYDRKAEWSAYGGDDCSWVPAFCGAEALSPLPALLAALLLWALAACSAAAL
jgi:hypothetical protein